MTAPENDQTDFLRPESVGKGGAVATPQVPAVPQQLGKYPLRDLVGAGSVGAVYKSLDPDNQREVAIKAISLSVVQATGEQSLAQFRIGMHKAQGLSHPNIVIVKGYGEEAGFAYIVMDWIRGQSLDRRFGQKARFSIEQVIDIQSQLLQALQYVHDRGQCHGNLKPTQILITTNGRVRVEGFGLARSGARMGTPGYIAPETYLNGEVDQLSDVYAAGAVFYELLTGIPPFTGTPNEIRRQVCERAPLPPSEVTRQASLRPFDAVALQALERDPIARLPTATQFLESLLKAYVYAGDPLDAADKTLVAELPAAAELTILLSAQTSTEPAVAAEPVATVEALTTVMPVAVATAASEAESSSAPSRHTQQLAQIQQRLMQLFGPIAAIMVRRAARETADMDALIQWLAARIDSPSERKEFLADAGAMSLRVNAPARVTTPPPIAVADASTRRLYGVESPAARPLTTDDMVRASQLLLSSLGPIAPILVKRTAQQPGCSREQFIATLASHLDDEGERATFLTALG